MLGNINYWFFFRLSPESALYTVLDTCNVVLINERQQNSNDDNNNNNNNNNNDNNNNNNWCSRLGESSVNKPFNF